MTTRFAIFAFAFLTATSVFAGEGEETSPVDEQALEACTTLHRIDAAEKAIKQEKQIGKVSGVVNKEVLHGAGSAIVKLKPLLREEVQAYNKSHKKKFTVDDCLTDDMEIAVMNNL